MLKQFHLILILLTAFLCDASGQVTIGQIEKNTFVPVLIPPTYDSLQNLENHHKQEDFKQYIGQQLYLPPFTNDQRVEPFLFSKEPNIIEIDVTNNSLRLTRISSQTSVFGKVTQNVEDYTKIYSVVYKPFHISSERRDPSVELSNDEAVSDQYYTVTDVLYQKERDNVWNFLFSKLWDKKNEFPQIVYRGRIGPTETKPSIIFVLRDDKSGETVYCFNPWKFILVPYFLKQKNLFENKTFVYNGSITRKDLITEKEVTPTSLSKWRCKEVTLLKEGQVWSNSKTKEKFKIYYILENDQGQTIALESLGEQSSSGNYSSGHYYFMLETIYQQNKQEEENNKQEQLAIRNELYRIKKQQELEEKEKFVSDCTLKFGQEDANLIVQKKVRIGMSQVMCRTAWGEPLWTDKKTTESGVVENWYYGFGYSLRFVDGVLSLIDE